MVEGAGPTYPQANGYQPGMAVCADTLCLSFSSGTRQFRAGEQIARRTAPLFVEVSPEKTAKLAKSFSLVTTTDGPRLRLTLPEGGQTTVPLL